MIQMAMQQKVAPALGAVYLSLATSQAATNDRVATLEQEVRTLRTRADCASQADTQELAILAHRGGSPPHNGGGPG